MSVRPGRGRETIVSAPGWTVGVLTETPLRQRSPAPRELVPDTASTHLQYGARVVLNSCHSLSVRIGWSRFEPMTRILWRRLRQDDGRCQIAGRLTVEGGSNYDRSYDRSAGPALPKVANPPGGSSLHPSENLPLNRNGRSSRLTIRDVRFA